MLSTDTDLTTSAHWGKLASDILTGSWEAALEELNSLREIIDSRSSATLAGATSTSAKNLPDPALAQLHSRTWLVHWSLFVYFNYPQGRILLLEIFLSPAYLNTEPHNFLVRLRFTTLPTVRQLWESSRLAEARVGPLQARDCKQGERRR